MLQCMDRKDKTVVDIFKLKVNGNSQAQNNTKYKIENSVGYTGNLLWIQRRGAAAIQDPTRERSEKKTPHILIAGQELFPS